MCNSMSVSISLMYIAGISKASIVIIGGLIMLNCFIGRHFKLPVLCMDSPGQNKMKGTTTVFNLRSFIVCINLPSPLSWWTVNYLFHNIYRQFYVMWLHYHCQQIHGICLLIFFMEAPLAFWHYTNRIWWLCLVPTSATRFARDLGYRMAKNLIGSNKENTFYVQWDQIP